MMTDLQTIHAVKSTYAYRLEQAWVALAQAQRHHADVLEELQHLEAQVAPSQTNSCSCCGRPTKHEGYCGRCLDF